MAGKSLGPAGAAEVAVATVGDAGAAGAVAGCAIGSATVGVAFGAGAVVIGARGAAGTEGVFGTVGAPAAAGAGGLSGAALAVGCAATGATARESAAPNSEARQLCRNFMAAMTRNLCGVSVTNGRRVSGAVRILACCATPRRAIRSRTLHARSLSGHAWGLYRARNVSSGSPTPSAPRRPSWRGVRTRRWARQSVHSHCQRSPRQIQRCRQDVKSLRRRRTF